MRKQLYLDIKERLMSIKTSNGEPLFRHFDLWNCQVEFLEEETPFATPAVFVEFDRMRWRTLGNRHQECTLLVRLHVVSEWFSGTASSSPIEDEALEFLDLTDHIALAMQGFSTHYMNSWMRTASITNHNHERYVDNVEEFTCLLRDTSAVSSTTEVKGINFSIKT